YIVWRRTTCIAVNCAAQSARSSLPKWCRDSCPTATISGAAISGSEWQVLGDDLAHDLARAAADGQEPRVAREALDGILAHVPVAAVELHAVVGDAIHHLGGGALDHGDLVDRDIARIVFTTRRVGG